jgi:DNA-binding PadR family transcriptional regulator
LTGDLTPSIIVTIAIATIIGYVSYRAGEEQSCARISSVCCLTPTVFHMLLALADGEKHGYGIMRAVEKETQGQMQIKTGSLYGSIRRMIEAGLIEETNERPDPELDDERRRYYGLTDFGRRVLAAEAARIAQVMAVIQRKQILGGV